MKIRDILNSKSETVKSTNRKEVVGKDKFNGNYAADRFRRTAREKEEQ
ncbi:hypothetical protein GNF82_14280 [Clostridium perfringens]